MECTKCGAEIADDAAYCTACGEASGTAANEESRPAAKSDAVRQQEAVTYAGFWLRAIAWVIDNVLLAIVVAVFIMRPLMEHAGLSVKNPWVILTGQSRQVYAINLMMLMAQWLYWAFFESSAWQATVGKKMLGLYVTDVQGKRLTFGRATGRFFGKIVSDFTFGVGYLMAGFTPKKQALHDIFAKCLVVRKRPAWMQSNRGVSTP